MICNRLTIRCTVCHHVAPQGVAQKAGISRLRNRKRRNKGRNGVRGKGNQRMAQRGKRVNGTENQTVICRIERRSCFCPRLYPSVKNRRQDYVCSCNIISAVAPSIFHNAGATVSQLTVLCVIGRHRLLSPDRHYNSEGRNRNVFSKKNYRREFFAGKPEGPEREDFGLRVTLIKGLSRRCRP